MTEIVKSYLYLVVSDDNTKFKIGYSINPKSRSINYTTHNPSCIFMGYFEVPNKKYETYIHYELLKKQFIHCKIKGKTEWFNGTLSLSELRDMIEKFKNLQGIKTETDYV